MAVAYFHAITNTGSSFGTCFYRLTRQARCQIYVLCAGYYNLILYIGHAYFSSDDSNKRMMNENQSLACRIYDTSISSFNWIFLRPYSVVKSYYPSVGGTGFRCTALVTTFPNILYMKWNIAVTINNSS